MKLVIGGAEYPFSVSFTLGEAMLIRQYSNLNLNELKGQMANPMLLGAFCHIALGRKHPEASEDEIRDRVKQIDLESLKVLSEEDDPSPPERSSNENENASENKPSGVTSNGGSAVSPETSPAPTGTPV